MATFNEELLQVFKKNLPAHANESIIRIYEENKQLQSNLDYLKNREEELLEKVKQKEKTIAAITAENNRLLALVKKEADLDADYEVLKEQQRNLEITILEAKYEALQQSKEEIKSLFKTIHTGKLVPENRYD